MCYLTFLPAVNRLCINHETDMAPALSPIMVTLNGSPPNFLIFFLTHFKAKIWSLSPPFPGAFLSPVVMNPNIPKR